MERCCGVGAGDVLGAIQDTPPSTWPATWARSTAGRVKWDKSLNPIFPILGVFSEEDPTWII